MITFSMNRKAYETDVETTVVVAKVVRAYREGGEKDASAISAMMAAGLATGRIRETDGPTKPV